MATTGDNSRSAGSGVVTPESLGVSPTVIGRKLAAPWKRLGAMLIDLMLVALLSLLAGTWLGIATGAMLLVLFGNDRGAPLPKKLVRSVCRMLGLVVIVLSILALGHLPFLKESGLRIESLTGNAPVSAAQKDSTWVAPEAPPAELRRAVERLQEQVTALKKEYAAQQEASASWLGQARSFAGALGVTFGWSGVYFTLLAGSWHGRTLGKLAFRIQPIKTEGTPFTYFDAFVRHGGYIAGVAMGLTGFLKLLWEPNRQAVEDRIAGTVVVDVQRQAGA